MFSWAILIILVSLHDYVKCNEHVGFTLFEKCLTSKNGIDNLVKRDDSSGSFYNKLNHQWNQRPPQAFPRAYFVPKSTEDVQDAVRCGVKSKIAVIPNSGGHSYESYSFGNNSTVIIDFYYMSDIEIESLKETATIGPGAMLGTVQGRLAANGFALPVGQCMKVGLGGHVLGGGSGYFVQQYGLALDWILEMTMVDAEGNAHLVNARRNPDLYWGLRGMGSGLIGIVTKFKFQLIPLAKVKLTYARLKYDMEDGLKTFLIWQDWLRWVETNAPTILSILEFTGSGRPVYKIDKVGQIVIDLLHIEDSKMQPEDNKRFIAQVLKTFPGSGTANFSTPTYLELCRTTGFVRLESGQTTADVDLDTLKDQVTISGWAKVKSFFVSGTFTSLQMKNVNEVLNRRLPETSIQLISQGGAVSQIPRTAMAYVHRTSPYSIEYIHDCANNPSAYEPGLAWMKEFEEATKFMDNGETYQNYVDNDLQNPYQRYYGENLPRLFRLKETYDPNGYFQDPQSIPV